jgi:glycosyltransferase
MHENTWITIITPTLNCEKTILACVIAVKNQEYKFVEHIIVDGNSTDGTIEKIKTSSFSGKLIIDSDKGIYAAINKGILQAKGQVIGILHGDDYYANNQVLNQVMALFQRGKEAVLGDVWYVPHQTGDKIIRKYSTKFWVPNHFKWGIQPPHPGFFLLKKKYLEIGLYKEHYEIAGDFEFLLRGFIKGNWQFYLIHEPVIFMRSGGKSKFSLKNLVLINKECWQACLENNFRIYPGQLLWRYLPKLLGVLLPVLGYFRRFLL